MVVEWCKSKSLISTKGVISLSGGGGIMKNEDLVVVCWLAFKF